MNHFQNDECILSSLFELEAFNEYGANRKCYFTSGGTVLAYQFKVDSEDTYQSLSHMFTTSKTSNCCISRMGQKK